MAIDPVTILGTAAGILSTSSFVPQLVKAWRGGDTEAISKRMYLITVTSFSLWIAYGVMLGSAPIVVFNALSLCVSAAILVLKLREAARGRRAAAA